MRLIDADAYQYPGDLVNEPTVDAVPVVKGKWICTEWGDPVKVCSICKRVPLAMPGTRKPFYSIYCPHCGSKMVGKESK